MMMYSRQPTFSATRLVSLSTEHLNQGNYLQQSEFSGVNDDCSFTRPSRWQQPSVSTAEYRSPSEAKLRVSAARSGSAVTSSRDRTNQLTDSLQALSLLANPNSCKHYTGMLRELDMVTFGRSATVRAGTLLHTGTSGKSGGSGSGRGIRGYELSDDLRAREIELMERYYGGANRAHRAARIIQNKYREYRMRVQFARLRSDKRACRRSPQPSTFYANDLPLSREHLANMEDPVLNAAYINWQSEDVLRDLGESQSGNLRSSAPSATTRGHVETIHPPQSAIDVSHSCSSLIASHKHQSATSSSPGATESTSGFVSSPGSGSSGSLLNESTPRSAEADVPNTLHLHQHARAPSNPPAAVISIKSPAYLQFVPAGCRTDETKQVAPCKFYLIDPVATSGEKEAPTTVSQDRQQMYVAVPLAQEIHHPQQHYHVVAQDGCKYMKVLYPSTQQPQPHRQIPTVLVRRSSLGSSSAGSGTPPRTATPVWCTPDGKMYTLAYSEAKKVVAMQPKVACQSPHQTQVLFVRRQPGSGGGAGDSCGHTPLQRCQLSKAYIEVSPSADIEKANASPQSLLVKVHPQAVFGNSVHPAVPFTATSITSAGSSKSPRNVDRCRKRLYRVCLNYFNKSPLKGIDMLIRYRFLETSPRQIARFLLNRRGLSRSAIGEYLGEMKSELAKASTRQFMRELDFREKDVDEALRILMSLFRTPGESQKIVHLLTEFESVYVEQNSARVKAQFQNSDSVMILAYAIVMLHTDMYSPNVRPQTKMTGQEFVKNLRGIDDGGDLDRNLLLSIYNRIQAQEMSVLPDHTDQVRNIHRLLTGPLTPPNLVLPQRRLVCYCRLFEVPDKMKRDRSGAHEREIFLFNDLLIVTKAFQKRRKENVLVYQVRCCVNLLGARVTTFETQSYPNGISICRTTGDIDVDKKSSPSGRQQAAPVICLNTKTVADRMRLVDDLQECIMETSEMDLIRLEDVISKQTGGRTSTDSAGRSAGSHLARSIAKIEVDAAPPAQYAFCKCMTEPVLHQPQLNVAAGGPLITTANSCSTASVGTALGYK